MFKAIFRKLFRPKSQNKTNSVNVYFISGMCYNCKVFDKLLLPEHYNKKYIEWIIPFDDEPLDSYARRMAKDIDTKHPYILVGYSFGAVIMQEMNKFLTPLKSIIISSFKAPDEIPTLFRVAKKISITEKVPDLLFASTQFITNAFNQFVFHMPTQELQEYMTVTDPRYIKWAVAQITQWIPENKCQHLYHIHGTDDQVFPYEKITRAFPIQGGDHLMVIKEAQLVSTLLSEILLIKEN